MTCIVYKWMSAGWYRTVIKRPKMRAVIFLSAVACAVAAPSGVILPLSPLAVPIALPAPTISPGDLQAAAIDAKVLAEDQARAIVDKARETAEQVVEEQKVKTEEVTDVAKERTADAFWAVEDQKWQVYDAVKTAEAQIDGAIASKAGDIAKSALTPVVVPSQFITPLAPITPFIFTPGIVAPKSAVPLVPEVKTEVKNEGLVKTADVSEKSQAEKSSVEPKKPELQPFLAPSPVLIFPPSLNTFPIVQGPVLTSFVKTVK